MAAQDVATWQPKTKDVPSPRSRGGSEVEPSRSNFELLLGQTHGSDDAPAGRLEVSRLRFAALPPPPARPPGRCDTKYCVPCRETIVTPERPGWGHYSRAFPCGQQEEVDWDDLSADMKAKVRWHRF